MTAPTRGRRRRQGETGAARRSRPTRSPSSERLEEAAELYKPRSACPDCGRPPCVRFTAAEVQRAKRERQSTRLQTAQCSRCGTRYWIQARDIAEAVLDSVITSRL